VATILFGVYPSLALDLFQPSVAALVEAVDQARVAAVEAGVLEVAAR